MIFTLFLHVLLRLEYILDNVLDFKMFFGCLLGVVHAEILLKVLVHKEYVGLCFVSVIRTTRSVAIIQALVTLI